MSTSSIIGTFNVLEMARTFVAQHLLMASTSAVFGANEKMPFAETDKADTRVTMYAATKKASESIARACAHLWEVPITMFRFFTVYGRWGRPDLAFYKFVDAILDGRPIEVYNHGNMHRDFPYVDDLVRGIRLLIDVVPRLGTKAKRIYKEMEPGDAPATWAGPSLLQARPAIAPKPICGRVSQGSSPGTANTTGNSVVHREAE